MHIASPPSRSIHRGLCVGVAVLGLFSTGAFAAAPSPASDIQARYEQERAKCVDGTSNQDRATCMKEAGAARDAAKRGLLTDGDAKYRRNARARCEVLTGDEARDCLARMRGQGTTSGSVQAGGIYRETVTLEVGKPVDPAASAVPAN